VFWVPKWQHARDEGLAAHPGPEGDRRVLVNSVDVVDRAAATIGYCFYDDAVTYRVADQEVVDDIAYVSRGSIRMELRDNAWRVGDLRSDSYTPSASNPCDAEAVAG